MALDLPDIYREDPDMGMLEALDREMCLTAYMTRRTGSPS